MWFDVVGFWYLKVVGSVGTNVVFLGGQLYSVGLVHFPGGNF